YVKQNICDPLKLSKTGVCVNGQEPPHLVKGYRTNPTGSYDTEWINYQQPFSSGNMYSTLGDLKRFTEAVFKAELFSAVILDKLKNDNSGKYGFGWGIRNVDSNRFYGHVGAMNGFVGGINYLPEEDLFIGYLTNDDNTSRYSISSSLTQLALGNDVPPVNKRTYKALSSDSLLDYAGNYLIKPGDTLKVFTKEKQLILQETGQAPQQLFCFGKHQFDFEQLEFDVRFNINNGVVADSLFFERKGNSFLRAARIN
ncbi:MAG: serine hydrolase domain-containing protein, partial [Salibacteraceae bacterium]